MFTGLIEDLGTLESRDASGDGARLRIGTVLAPEIAPGDSVAVNGTCLTAVEVDDAGFTTEAMNQTLALTSLGPIPVGGRLNLELAMAVGDRLGGHIVQGHVDGTGEIISAEDDGFSRRIRVGLPAAIARYVVERGSITIDGVSLTVSAVGDEWLEVSLIPETLERTNLDEAVPGTVVNLESDVIAKYVERLMSGFMDKQIEG